jgi:hypothetical protein
MAGKLAPTAEEVRVALVKSVQHNAKEYRTRVEALRGLHAQQVFNPPVDPSVLAAGAAEAGAAATGGKALTPGRDGEFSVRLGTRDPQAESEAKAKGWKGNGKEQAEDEGGEVTEGAAGNGGVQARKAALFFGRQGEVPQAGNSYRTQPVGPVVEVVQAKDQGEAQAIAQKALDDGAISATVRVKYSVVVVRE